ncbi:MULTISPECIES: hypothetical protein [Flammeovirga]|uniref:Uncharacterized protein n=1 Tax=Flammeovirga agarivorans TaxID=2726742 RepID=A0A7X8SL41_9BACT|nr:MULTISPECIES: hypothetical protein [Flammeovirga]NLR92250.1 hypothetical protein [Flammeovirga agarivorans]
MNLNLRLVFFSAVLIFFSTLEAKAQKALNFIRDIEIHGDTSINYLSTHGIIQNRRHRNEKTLPFHFESIDQAFEFRLYLKNSDQITDVKLIHTNEINVLEEPLAVSDDTYKFSLQFTRSSKNLRPSIIIVFWTIDGKELRYEQQLLPYTNTVVELSDKKSTEVRELYIGEEKEYEVLSNHIQNIRVDNIWHEQKDLSWRLYRKENRLFLSILPKFVNSFSTEISFETHAPNFLYGKAQYETFPLNLRFIVKEPRLTFLSTDRNEVVFEDTQDNPEGIEIQIQQNRKLELQKTYRIENQEEKGGHLIAELFTRNNLSNNRTLCWLRVYDYHSLQDGYLYIKDGDDPKFITNFNIISKTIIESIQILRPGRNWTSNLFVYPGETVAVKFQGKQMQHARYLFEGLRNRNIDSVTTNMEMQTMQISIPININQKELKIYNGNEDTGYAIKIREKQAPRNFDFVTIDCGDGPKVVSQIEKPIFYPKAITDVILRFHPDLIDDQQLYGKQYITLDVRVIGPQGQLIELAKDENIVICPGVSSPRYHNYEKNNCTDPLVTLNKYLGIKTHRFEDWTKLEIYISHQKEKYSDQVYKKKIEIYASRKSQFDIDLSFPAGLLVKKANEDDISSGISGISISAIAQFKFFKPGTIGRVRPYRFGVGSIALNAFNLSDNEDIDRDLGIVALGSVHPLQRPGRKLSLPLYIGFGYFLKAETWFWMIGPGISVSF